MLLDWFDGGGTHIKSEARSTRFSVGDVVCPSPDYIKKAKKGYFGQDALDEFERATIVNFERDSGSKYVSPTSYAVLRNNKGKIIHRHERWIKRCNHGMERPIKI